MEYLCDTMVLSEWRKRGRCNSKVAAWFGSVSAERIYVSVITLGEIRRGIESLKARDPQAAHHLDRWLKLLPGTYEGRVLGVTEPIAERWGRITPREPLGAADGLIAATALHHDLTVATRNLTDFARSGAKLFDPWTFGA